jgi:rod shape-determining protein MreD
MDLTPLSPDVLRAPPRPRFVLVSFVVGFMLHLIPATGSWLVMRPEVPLLLLIYWTVHQPRTVGFIVAFLLGIAMDVADAGALGQHPLAYSVAVYLAFALRVRILKFTLWQQALHVLAILLASQLVMLLTNAFLPSKFPGMLYFLASFIGAALWIPLSLVIRYLHLHNARLEDE